MQILARDNVCDDIFNFSSVGASTCNNIFKLLVKTISKALYSTYLSMPEKVSLRAAIGAYETLRIVGAFGFIDCTHLWRERFPDEIQNNCRGKEGKSTLSFQAIVGPNK